MQYVMQRVSWAACLGGVASVVTAQATLAQEQPQLQEIVVTAQKRAENVQDVPLAISAIGGEQLERANVREFADMSRVAPSLNIRSSDTPVNASVALRGIGTFAFGIGVEPSVAVQIDDVPVSFQARAFSDMTDVERVEILRGPQSTLYGKSASAGLINITTKAPTDQLTSLLSLTGTSDEEFRAAGSISGPLGPQVSYRLTASHSDFAGNVDNIASGRTVNGREDTTIRGKVVWNPADALSITAGANYSNTISTAVSALSRISPSARLRGTPGLTPDVVLPGIFATSENLNISHDTEPYSKSHGIGESLKIQYDFANDFSLVSITANDRYRLSDQLDVDRTAYVPWQNFQGGTFRAEVITQELRLLSPSDRAVQFTTGLFYGGNDLTRRFSRGPLFSLANWYATSDSEVKALFGQADWRFLPRTTATLGARAQDEDIEYTFDDFQNVASFSGSSSDTASTYRVGLRQELSDDVMVFASFATGHKGQTYDLTTGFNAQRAAAGPVQPEESKSYELGLKSQLLERRVTLNITAFNVLYDDFQQQGIEQIGGVQNFRLTNVGSVKTRGVEIETDFQATRQLRLNGAVAYIDAIIDQFPAANCYPGQTAAQGCIGTPARQDLSGQRLPSAPEWKLNIGWDYDRSLGSLPFEGTFSGTYLWQSEQNFSLTQDPETIQDSYGVLSLAAGIRHPDAKYRAEVFVNNVLDKGYAVNGGNQFGNFGSTLATEFQPARDSRRYGGIRLTLAY
jgi:iron complex outermembrane recepter protein